MTDPSPLKPDLGRFGGWTALVGPGIGQIGPEQAVEIERLGYGAVWVGHPARIFRSSSRFSTRWSR